MIAWLLATALGGECVYVGLSDILAVKAPAVIVLGERHGTQPDLRRAGKVVRALADRMKVRVALEAVHRDQQAVLDDLAAGRITYDQLGPKLDWEEAWGFPMSPYKPLLTAASLGAKVVGVGLDLGGRPDGVEVPVPPRYLDLLRPSLGGHELPVGQEGRFVEAMAWRDHAIARAALEGWDEKGWLVIVTGRGHVEGGKGVGWQAAQLTSQPVSSFILANGEDPPCHPGDRIWR